MNEYAELIPFKNEYVAIRRKRITAIVDGRSTEARALKVEAREVARRAVLVGAKVGIPANCVYGFLGD